MSAPTTLLTNGTGTITVAGEGNGFLIPSNPNIENPVLNIGVSSGGAFTSVVLAVRSKMSGLTNYYPQPVLRLTDNSVPSNSASISLTNSTVVMFQMSLANLGDTEVYVVSGTFASGITIEANISSGNGSNPISVAVNSAGSGSFVNVTASGTLGVTGAATLSSTLDVTGAATFASTVGITGVTTLTGGSVQPDNAVLYLGTGNDIGFKWDATDLIVSQAAPDSIIKWGASGAGINHTFYGDTATRDLQWDQSNDQLLALDNTKISIGTGAGAAGDISFSWDATRLNITQLNTNSEIRYGVDGAGIDQMWFGDTASAFMNWDQSADQLIFGGVASVSGLRVATSGATAITTTRAVTKADSGGIFTAAQSSSYTITVAQPAGAGEKYTIQCVSPGSFTISLVATGCTFEGIIQIDGTGIPATGSTLTFASAAAALGDTIILTSTSTTKFNVLAFAQATGGITVA